MSDETLLAWESGVAPRTMPSVPGFSVGCLFAGMGGFASAFAESGFRVAWATDIDKTACATFAHRFPGVKPLERDIRDLHVDPDELTPVDVLTAGFPCQSFSPAGNKRGFDDERGESFFAIPRLLNEFGPETRPKLVVLENVPSILSGGELSWFDTIQRSTRKAGYWFRRTTCWRANVKDYTGIPQDRERVFLVGASKAHFRHNPFRPPSKSPHETDASSALGYDCDPRPIDRIVDRTARGSDELYLGLENKYGRMIAAKMESGNAARNIFQLRRNYVREWKGGLCPTLTANMGVGGHNVPFIRDEWGIRKLSVPEVAALQGFNGAKPLFPDIPDSQKYRLLGNAVCVSLGGIVASQCRRILEERSQ